MSKNYLYLNPLIVNLTRQEYIETKNRMIQFFAEFVYNDYSLQEYPIWEDSARQLMECAWWLWKWHVMRDPKTGRNMTLTKIATRLCMNLHVKLPKNISAVVHQSLKSGRKSVIEYYATLWREAKVGMNTMVRWEERIKFPCLPKSYRGLFD